MDAQLKISRGITRLLINYPFWGSLALGTSFIKDENIKTMATNGKWIKWNPAFVDGMTEAETMGVVVHELCHIVLKHMIRRGNREPKKWNVATDYAINLIVIDEGFSLPSGGLFDRKHQNLMAEKIFDIIEDPESEPEWGLVEDTDLSEDEKAEMEVDIDQRVTTAANHAKNIGKLPAFVDGILKDMEAAQVDWRDKMRRFFMGDQPDDYTFRRPERKAFYQMGIIAPSIDRRGAGHIVVGIDTSGSVSDQELHHFLGEINSISTEVKPMSVTVIYCDMNINNVSVYEAGDEITEMHYKSRGGTRVMPVFDYIEQNGLPVDHMVYLTDLEIFDFPDRVPYPLLWVSSAPPSVVAPVGDTVTIKIK